MTTKKIETERKYFDWTEHPQWKELCEIVNKIEHLENKAKELRDKIQREVFLE